VDGRANEKNTPRRQMRQPRVAEVVAERLRTRILNGELADGDLLPPQDALIREIGSSPASAREAYRILETERLITVRRGNEGGAIIHAPTEEAVAYLMTVVLEANGVSLHTVADALRVIEPACIAMCARRADRATAVVPTLATSITMQADSLHHAAEFATAGREFHEAVVRLCGNRSLGILVGAYERILTSHREAWAPATLPDDDEDTAPMREQVLADHRRILDAIVDGRPERAELLGIAHLEHFQQLTIMAGDHALDANLLRA
jgi:DNA-binding FadR family transcriptional regulator